MRTTAQIRTDAWVCGWWEPTSRQWLWMRACAIIGCDGGMLPTRIDVLRKFGCARAPGSKILRSFLASLIQTYMHVEYVCIRINEHQYPDDIPVCNICTPNRIFSQ